ncbi:MAG: peptide chain release factor N(5)-glutamine methyltransferase [Ruminococcaceae bacterium]|nr:peptide chain release factor N(5)-glutamine methyltransferase [Oscillospiraceae bacterium]
MRTYNEVYLSARKALKAAGIEAFSLEARLICACAADKTKEQFLRDMKFYVSDGYVEKVGEMLARRLKGEPTAYITGEWEFYGVPLEVTPDVLIPRNDTEILVDRAIELLKGRMSTKRVLDLCTGSGCVGISVAVNVPDSRVILIDKSLRAMSIARANVLKNNVMRNVTCVDADALKAPPILLGSFDMILCNPPYIPTEDILALDTSVRDYEPVMALDGGRDGLDFYRSVASKWKSILKPKGILMFECGEGQAQSVAEIMDRCGFTNLTAFKDTLGIDRVMAGILM